MGNLADYAREELTRAGLFDSDDYDGMIAKNVMEIVEVFSKGGHSGSSAAITADIVNKLLRYEPLTPLTYEPDEWIDQTEASGGKPTWQNKRKFSVFSNDGGKTHYDLDKED